MRRALLFGLSVLALMGSLLGGEAMAQSQPQPVNCLGTPPTPPNDYGNWNWESNPFQTSYCDTWSASLRVPGATVNTLLRMGAPWVNPKSRTLARIGEKVDYLKADGWELVRLDFGGNNGTDMPNFILYNKYKGTLRVFAYLTESQTYGKVIMTMASAEGIPARVPGQVSAVGGLSQPLLRAPDKYLASRLNDDLTTYICELGGSRGWIMGEFTMLFDPNYADPKFYESKLEFKIYGILTGGVDLGGDFNFTTKPDDGFGFAGKKRDVDATPNSGPNGAKTFIASGAKFLGQVRFFR